MMSTDQCAQNPDGSLKDAKDIQWFHDKDDTQPLPSTAAPVQPLGRGLRNKATSRFSEAVVREQLGSDEEDLGAFVRPPRRKRAAQPARALNVAAAAPPSRNSFEVLPVEDPSDEDDGTFETDTGSESGDVSGDGLTDLDSISNNEVRAELSPYNPDFLSSVARQCPAKKDNSQSRPW